VVEFEEGETFGLAGVFVADEADGGRLDFGEVFGDGFDGC